MGGWQVAYLNFTLINVFDEIVFFYIARKLESVAVLILLSYICPI